MARPPRHATAQQHAAQPPPSPRRDYARSPRGAEQPPDFVFDEVLLFYCHAPPPSLSRPNILNPRTHAARNTPPDSVRWGSGYKGVPSVRCRERDAARDVCETGCCVERGCKNSKKFVNCLFVCFVLRVVPHTLGTTTPAAAPMPNNCGAVLRRRARPATRRRQGEDQRHFHIQNLAPPPSQSTDAAECPAALPSTPGSVLARPVAFAPTHATPARRAVLLARARRERSSHFRTEVVLLRCWRVTSLASLRTPLPLVASAPAHP